MSKAGYLLGTVLISLLLSAVTGCANPEASQQELLATDSSQVELRSIQSRVFDTADKEGTLRTIMATMQDLDFMIDRADLLAGVVTGSKFDGDTVIKLTASVRERNASQLIVRINVQYGLRAVEAAKPYQDFFFVLEKSMFLTAQQI